jgi:hypothetical protein
MGHNSRGKDLTESVGMWVFITAIPTIIVIKFELYGRMNIEVDSNNGKKGVVMFVYLKVTLSLKD